MYIYLKKEQERDHIFNVGKYPKGTTMVIWLDKQRVTVIP